jgi:hypothetical protein
MVHSDENAPIAAQIGNNRRVLPVRLVLHDAKRGSPREELICVNVRTDIDLRNRVTLGHQVVRVSELVRSHIHDIGKVIATS